MFKSFVYIFLFLFISTKSFASPEDLISKSLDSLNKINSNTPQKERLAAYENIFSNIDSLFSEYGSSDYSIKIKSGEKIGLFNYNNLTKKYLSELTDFYNKVCEVSPSYSCVAFVSFSKGASSCNKADSFSALRESHSSIENAIYIFSQQDSLKKYQSFATQAYQSCLKRSKVNSTPFIQDYFESRLVDLFISTGNSSRAKALIENAQTPYFKFKGVMSLYRTSNKPFNRDFWNRMTKYINQKIKQGDQAALSFLDITVDASIRADFKLDQSIVSNSAPKLMGNWGALAKECNVAFNETIFNKLILLAKNAFSKAPKVKIDPKQKKMLDLLIKMGHDKNSDLYKSTIASMNDLETMKTDEITSILHRLLDRGRYTDIFGACSKEEIGNYKAALYIYIFLLAEEKVDYAENFISNVKSGSLNYKEQLTYLFENQIRDSKTLNKYLNKKDYIKLPLHQKYIFNLLIGENLAKPLIFRTMVDSNDVCGASTYLFKELKGSNDFTTAINYFATSPRIDPKKKYKCGDEDLELLLQ